MLPGTPKNTAIYCTGASWRSKWPLGPARVLQERSEGLFLACCSAASALKIAVLACSGATSVLKKPARARLSAGSALNEAVRACCSRSLNIQKCWSRLHCALTHCTLLRFATCMDMHGFTLVYIDRQSHDGTPDSDH